MAIPILNHLDLRSVSELQNAILHTTTTGSASNVEGKIIYDTGTNTIQYYNGSAWISLTGLDANTWRPVTAGGNSLTASETLAFTAGTNVTITESGGAVTINSTYTDTNTNQLTTFTIRDDDNDAKVVAQSKFIKFISATGTAGTNWSGAGTTGDPWIMTITSPDTTTNTQNIFTSTWVDGGSPGGVDLRLTRSGAGSGSQDVKIIEGSNITLTLDSSSQITIASTDTNTWRTVTAGGNTLSTSETLAFTAGANIAITESAGAVTITSTDTNTDTLQTISNDTTDAERFVTFVTSATGAQAGQSDANFKFNPGTDTLSVTNLVVSGTQTTKNETIQVVTDNTISFEGSTADAHEIHLTGADATADRTITLPDTTGTVALTSDIGNGTITIAAGNALTTGGSFTTNASGNSTITLHHEDTSSQASVDNSGRAYIQDITLDTYGHVTSLTSATETVVDTNTQLATAAAVIDVSAMAGNNNATIDHSLTSKNLVVQLYDTTSGLTVMADIDHVDTDTIKVTFSQTGTQMVAASIGDIRVIVIDAKHGLSDITPTYS
jgi:hypothetical protein